MSPLGLPHQRHSPSARPPEEELKEPGAATRPEDGGRGRSGPGRVTVCLAVGALAAFGSWGTGLASARQAGPTTAAPLRRLALLPQAGPAASGTDRLAPGTCASLLRDGRPVVHWHISKAAGSTICFDAVRNGETVVTLKELPSYKSGKCGGVNGTTLECHKHCHPPAGASIQGTIESQTARYAVSFVEEGLTFIAPETQMPRFENGYAHAFGPDPEQSVYSSIVLREPRTRMVSWYVQHVPTEERRKTTYRQSVKADLAPDLAIGKHNLWGEWSTFPMGVGPIGNGTMHHLGIDHRPSLREWLEIFHRDHHNDNFQIRYLLGLKFDPVEITAVHLEAAKERLRRDMNAVFLTERLSEAGCLYAAMGWKQQVGEANMNKASSSESEGGDGPPAPPPDSDEALERYVGRAVGPGAYAEVKELLDELNVFDAQLYEYAAELFQEKLELCELCAEGF